MSHVHRKEQIVTTTLGSSADKLLRLARLQSDDTNAALASVRVARASTETALAQLDHQLLTEQRKAEEQRDIIDTSEFMNNFSERVRIKRANMLATLAQLDAQEQSLNDDLSNAYKEIKKFERLIELSERREHKRRAKLKQNASDDLIGVRYGR